jgi:acetate---CoA ligase (ADP-forming)
LPERPGIESFFHPRSIAVAGVSTDPDKLGSVIYTNLLENRAKGLLKASVYALNPAHEFIDGNRAYPSVGSLPEIPELMIVAVPESQTEALIVSAADAGAKAVIIVTSGYAETGKKDVEERIARVAARSGMRILGPNTIGVVDTKSGVDSLFLHPTKKLPDGRVVPSLLRPLKGGIAIVTQSGHLGQAIVEELSASGVGIRALVGTGNQVDVSVEDVIDYFGRDPETRVIAAYVEGVRDGRKFMDVARRVARQKPIVALKVGKTRGGARAALTHTASLVGDYDVYRAAFRQAGVIEARSFQELVDYAVALSMLPPTGNRLTIITNAGGVGALAADEAQEAGLRVEPLDPEAAEGLRSEFGDSGFMANASLGNPIDLTASAGTAGFVKVTEEVAGLRQYDLVLVLPTHQTPAIATDIADRLVEAAHRLRKPVCMCVVGRAALAEELQRTFMESGIPSFPTPERAVRALSAAWLYTKARAQARAARTIPVTTKRSRWKKGQLSQLQISNLLRSYGIAQPQWVVLRSPRDFGLLDRVSYPVACKLLSRDIPHKKDVGGVVLEVRDPAGVRSCFARLRGVAEQRNASFDGVLVQRMSGRGIELILGGKKDPTFGQVVALGLGGTYVELSREVSLAVAPVDASGVRSMIEGTRLEQIIRGYRSGPRASIGKLCRAVASFSKILAENPSITEMEVNPVIATRDEVLAVDARASSS